MRRSEAAFALIRRVQQSQIFWLAKWNRNWQGYHLVGGHRFSNEAFRECAIREIDEELGLCHGVDICVADEPLAHFEYTDWSKSANVETAYTVELFSVEILNDSASEKIASDPQNHWLTEAEISAERCTTGEPVSRTMRLLLFEAGLV